MNALDGLLFIFMLACVILIYGRNRHLQQRLVELTAQQRNLRHTNELSDLNAQRMALLTDTTFDALLVVDSDKRMMTLNKTARELFHVTEPATGQLTLMAVTRQHELDTLVDDILKSGEALESQVEVKGRTFRVRSTIVKTGAEKPYVLLAMQDISELLRLTRARRDMVANFSHDLRTPISSIRLLVDTLLQNFGKNPERDQRLLGKIAGETDSLQHMTQELIDLSMIESGQAIVRMVPVDFSDILREALNIMGTQIEQKKLQVVNEIPDKLMVLVDPEQTRRVMNNLIHNSVKFTPAGGQILFNAITNGTMSTIRVRDTGPGIPPQDRTRIFERFYQVDASRGESSGSGLGLSIAKHIVEAQGGNIWAEAGIPHGACLCFTVPLAGNDKNGKNKGTMS